MPLDPPHSAADAPRVRTSRLELVAATAAMARADADRNHPLLGDLLDADVPEDWPPATAHDALELWAGVAEQRPAEAGWWNWFIVRDDAGPNDRMLVGSIGFKGPPDASGSVEIGFAVLPSYQAKGFATEAAEALLAWAWRAPQATHIYAETLPYLPAAMRVLEKLGFRYSDDGVEPGAVRLVRTRESR